MNKLVKLVKLNNLQYNPNRDPQVYRRVAGESFRVQAFLAGSGTTKCTVRDAAGKALVEAEIAAPGTFEYRVAFDKPGQYLVTLEVSRAGETFAQPLRLDVLEHAWIG
ncbi:MAG: hypothetical protein KJ025_07570 [Burkholderiales bacterium]|nr:hypothetical protein [Burkholderiales bacterium]